MKGEEYKHILGNTLLWVIHIMIYYEYVLEYVENSQILLV